MAAASKPDGYTIAQLPITVFRLPLMQEVSWDPAKDFSYIIHLTGYTFGVTTSAKSQFKSWKDVVDFAKQNPGKVTYATPGTGTSLHIGMEQIAGMAGIKLTQVPFKGGAETNAAALGQHTMLQADSTGWRPLVDAGKLRLLMVWTSVRSPNFPDVPTLKELGYPMVYNSPFGIGGPKGMDPEDRRQAARCLQEGDRGPRRDRHARQIRHGAELQEHRGLQEVRRRDHRFRTQGDRYAGAGEEDELIDRVPDAVQRAWRCSAEPGPTLRAPISWTPALQRTANARCAASGERPERRIDERSNQRKTPPQQLRIVGRPDRSSRSASS